MFRLVKVTVLNVTPRYCNCTLQVVTDVVNV
jgi:hypothetical protein